MPGTGTATTNRTDTVPAVVGTPGQRLKDVIPTVTQVNDSACTEVCTMEEKHRMLRDYIQIVGGRDRHLLRDREHIPKK